MNSTSLLKTILIFILLIVSLASQSDGQLFEWGHIFGTPGGTQFAGAGSVTMDNSGNIYMAGNSTDVTDLDPGPGIYNIGTAASTTNQSTFIAKYSSSGQLVWAVEWSRNISFSSLATDAGGNLYAGGNYNTSLDIDPGPGVQNITSNGQADMIQIKLNPSGNLVWANAMGSINQDNLKTVKVDPTGNLVITGSFQDTVDFDPGLGLTQLSSGSGLYSSFVAKYDSSGQLLWAGNFEGTGDNHAQNLVIDPLGNLFVCGRFKDTVDFDPDPNTTAITITSVASGYLIKLNGQGNFQWSKTLGGNGVSSLIDISIGPTGNLFAVGGMNGVSVDVDPGPSVYTLFPSQSESSFILGLDSLGNLNWVNHLDDSFAFLYEPLIECVATGELMVCGLFTDTYDFDPGPGVHVLTAVGTDDPYILKLDSLGNFIWAGNMEAIADGEIFDMQLSGQEIVFAGQMEGPIDLDPTPGVQQDPRKGLLDGFLVKLALAPYVNLIQGQIYFDENQNCQKDPNEQALAGVPVWIQPSNQYTVTDSNGYYSFQPDTGAWSLSVIPPAPTWSAVCPTGGVHTLTLSLPNDTITGQDFALNGPDCPYMSVNVAGGWFRPGRYAEYAVNWCNLGTGQADSVYVEFTSPSSILTIDSASIPWRLPQNGDTYIFDLDTAAVMQCGTFHIYATVDTSAILQQSICVDAHIYPDSFCFPASPLWDGSHVELEATCDTLADSVKFLISNNSAYNMTGTGAVVVLEDDVLVMQDSVILPAGTDTTIALKANGSTWAMRVKQVDFHPGLSYPTAFIEGCGTDTAGTFTTGFVVQYPKDDADPFRDTYCAEVSASYDPNDKRGFPTGFYANHQIETNQHLDYIIRFQNTGNDTAFKVVVRDTLDLQTLDIRSFRLGAASHPFTFRLYGPGIAEWTFDPIELPDSNVNWTASQGFLGFTIDQKANNPVGTRIENSADIYFDYNVPVLTNTAWHTIGGVLQEFIDINLIEDTPNGIGTAQPITIKAYPNPFTNHFTIQISGAFFQRMELTLFNTTGKTVKTAQVRNTNQIKILREGLSTGMYLYQLKGDGKVINTGKMILR